MERNGFGPSTTFGLEEEKPGSLKLYQVNAPGKQLDYGRDSSWKVRDIVVKELANQGIDANKEVIVIFQQGLRWEDGKATEVGSFVGAGAPSRGTAWFYDDPMLDPDKLSSKEPGGYYHRPCSIGEFNSHYIGGIAHELGHALTLPHDCELSTENRELGFALMGSGNHTFGREERGEGKGAFLTYAEALILSVVPAINGKEPARRNVDVKLVDFKAERVSKDSVKFSGKIEAGSPVLGLIFYEDKDSRASDYDAKTLCVKPNEDGTFEGVMPEVAAEPSELRVRAVRDVDAIELFRVSYNPNGEDGEFAPIDKAFQIRKIESLFANRDADGLKSFAETENALSDDLKEVCVKLSSAVASSAPLVSPESAEGDSFDLTNAEFESAKVGWSRLTREISFDGSLMQSEGTVFSSGLSAHAPSDLRAKLGAKWNKFRFDYCVQSGRNGSVVFVVKGDDKELFRSELIKDHKLRSAELDVSGVDVLELIVEDGGNGNTADHSLWIRPVLTR